MQVQLSEIERKEKRYDVPDENWLPVEGVTVLHVADAHVCGRLTKAGDPLFYGQLAVTVAGVCSRCGQSVSYEVAESFRYVVAMDCEADCTEAERQCSEAECDMVFLERPELDLGEILREQLLLSLPLRVLCRKECRGLCPYCGVPRQQEVCHCGCGESTSPFAVLGTLEKK